MLRNGLVQKRLGETWLITFIVTVLAVTQQVDENISIKSLAVFHCKADSVYQGFRIITVHMEYRCQDHLRYVRTIGRRTRIEVVGGKSNLVVDHNVQGSSGLVAVQGLHLHRFVHNTLRSNGRITMDENRQNLFTFHRVIVVDLRTCNTLNYWVNRLKV